MFFVVVVIDIIIHIVIKFKTCFCWMKSEVVVFDGFPKAFYPDVVDSSSFAIH